MLNRQSVVVLTAALANPTLDTRALLAELGGFLLLIEDQVYRVNRELDKLGARVDRLEAAARRPLLVDASEDELAS